MSRGGASFGGTPKSFSAAAAIVAALAIALCAAPAQAATTRAEYVAQVDPICQAGQAQVALVLQPFLRAAKRAKRHHSLNERKTARKLRRMLKAAYAQTAVIGHQVNDQIATVPPAPDDVSLIQVWLRARNEFVDLETQLLSAKPKTDKQAFRLFSGFFVLSARALEVSDLVRDFGFVYCTTYFQVDLFGTGIG